MSKQYKSCEHSVLLMKEVITIKIILGSQNNSKKEAIIIALIELGIENFEIESLEVDSYVSSK